MTKFAASVVVITGAILFSGCANMPVHLDTPSGNPEVVIAGKSKKEITTSLMSHMLNNGWQIKTADDYHIVFKHVADSMGAMMMFGSNFNAIPEARADYTFVESNGAIRIVAALRMASNPGSGYEQETELHGEADMKKVQDALNAIKAELATK